MQNVASTLSRLFRCLLLTYTDDPSHHHSFSFSYPFQIFLFLFSTVSTFSFVFFQFSLSFFVLAVTNNLLLCHRHTHPFNGPLSGTTWVSEYQKDKTNLNFTEGRDCEWQWHQLDHVQVCISLQTDNHASTPPLSFLQAGCPSCHPSNSVKASTQWRI